MDDGVRGADREDEGGQEVYTDGESDEITDQWIAFCCKKDYAVCNVRMFFNVSIDR